MAIELTVNMVPPPVEVVGRLAKFGARFGVVDSLSPRLASFRRQLAALLSDSAGCRRQAAIS